MSESAVYYQHSGAIGKLSPLWMLVFGTIAGLILAWLYAQLINVNPLVYFNFIGSLAFGGLLGGLVGVGAKVGHCRNLGVLSIATAGLSLLAVYLYWVFWIHAFADGQWAFTPTQISGVISLIGQTGLWSLNGMTPKGGMLYSIWGVEGALILATAVVCARTIIKDTPYCEDCSAWIAEAEELGRLHPETDAASLRSSLEGGEFSAIENLQPANEGEEAMRFDLAACEHCNQRHYLSVALLQRKEEKGETKWVENELLNNLLISPGNTNKLRRALSQQPANA